MGGPSLLPSFSPDSVAWPPRAFQGPQLLWLHLLKDLQEVPGNLTCLVSSTWAQVSCPASLLTPWPGLPQHLRDTVGPIWAQVSCPASLLTPWPGLPEHFK